MGFIESYKHLEKLYGEVMNDDRRISAYIDEMINTPRGSFFVRGWDNDLKQLKHYRWIRNQIAHEPDCTEQTMCAPGDAEWLDAFYARIMNQTDPLTLYAKATAPKPATKVTHMPKAEPGAYAYSQEEASPKKSSKKAIGVIAVLATIALLVAVVFMFSKAF